MVDTQSVSIEIPENLSDISLEKYKKFILMASEENGDEIALYQFCGLTPQMQEGMKKNDLDEIRTQLANVLSEKPSLIKTFKYNGVEYGFHPHLEDISMGEYIDLEEYLKDPYKQAEKVLGVLYRPIKQEKFGRYLKENYHPDKHNGMGFQSLGADIFLGCLLFFYRLENRLQQSFLQSLEKDQMMALTSELNSVRNGDGMEQYTKLLKEIYSTLIK